AAAELTILHRLSPLNLNPQAWIVIASVAKQSTGGSSRQKVGLLRRFAPRKDEKRSPQSLFKILNTPLAMAMQRLSTVTSVVMKMRLRVERTTCGFEIRTSPILPASTKCVSSCTVASVGLPDTNRAVMPQVRTAQVISTP